MLHGALEAAAEAEESDSLEAIEDDIIEAATSKESKVRKRCCFLFSAFGLLCLPSADAFFFPSLAVVAAQVGPAGRHRRNAVLLEHVLLIDAEREMRREARGESRPEPH